MDSLRERWSVSKGNLALLRSHFRTDANAPTRALVFGSFGGALAAMVTLVLPHRLSLPKRFFYFVLPWALTFTAAYATRSEFDIARFRLQCDAILTARRALGLPSTRSAELLQEAAIEVTTDRFGRRTLPELTDKPYLPSLPLSNIFWLSLGAGPAFSMMGFLRAYPGIKTGVRPLLSLPSALITHTIPIALVWALSWCAIVPLVAMFGGVCRKLARPLLPPSSSSSTFSSLKHHSDRSPSSHKESEGAASSQPNLSYSASSASTTSPAERTPSGTASPQDYDEGLPVSTTTSRFALPAFLSPNRKRNAVLVLDDAGPVEEGGGALSRGGTGMGSTAGAAGDIEGDGRRGSKGGDTARARRAAARQAVRSPADDDADVPLGARLERGSVTVNAGGVAGRARTTPTGKRRTMRLFPEDPLPEDALPRKGVAMHSIPMSVIQRAYSYARTARVVREEALARFDDQELRRGPATPPRKPPVPRLDPEEVDAYCGAVHAAVCGGGFMMKGWRYVWLQYVNGTGIEEALAVRERERAAAWRAAVEDVDSLEQAARREGGGGWSGKLRSVLGL